jgi:hypothetical protein
MILLNMLGTVLNILNWVVAMECNDSSQDMMSWCMMHAAGNLVAIKE